MRGLSRMIHAMCVHVAVSDRPWQVGDSDRDPGTVSSDTGSEWWREEWRMEGGEGGRGEYYTKIVGLRESISSTGAVVKELIIISF